MVDSLIEKLESLKAKYREGADAEYYLMEKVLHVVRQHQAEQPEDVVARVANAVDAMMRNWREIGGQEPSPREIAKAAIAAMGSSCVRPQSDKNEQDQPSGYSDVVDLLKRAREVGALAIHPGHTDEQGALLAKLYQASKAQQREIPVVDEAVLKTAMTVELWGMQDAANVENVVKRLLPVIRPYLRQPEPEAPILTEDDARILKAALRRLADSASPDSMRARKLRDTVVDTLRTPVPVSSKPSLSKIIMDDEYCNQIGDRYSPHEDWRWDVAKSVLDAAGVKYEE